MVDVHPCCGSCMSAWHAFSGFCCLWGPQGSRGCLINHRVSGAKSQWDASFQFCLFTQPQSGILTLKSRPWPLLCVCRFGDLTLDAVEEGDDEECEEGSNSEQRHGPSSSALVADSDGGVAGLSSSEEVDAAVKQVGLRLT